MLTEGSVQLKFFQSVGGSWQTKKDWKHFCKYIVNPQAVRSRAHARLSQWTTALELNIKGASCRNDVIG